MSQWKTYSESTFCFITKTIVDWQNVLDTDHTCDVIICSFSYCQQHKKVTLHAYVIMPNHVHCILSASNGKLISGMMRDFGTFTSRKISECLIEQNRVEETRRFQQAAISDNRGNDFKIWQEGFHPIIITNEQFYRQKRDYIHENPVRKGFAQRIEDWKYSSARNYMFGDHSLIHVACL
jgi:REP element-mobilizing transposase RayT